VVVVIRAVGAAEQPSLPLVVGLPLLPGALGVAAYVVLAGPVKEAGYPPLAAFLLAAGLVILPVDLGTLWLAGGRARAAGETLIPYREPLLWRSWAWRVPVLLVAAIVLSVIMAAVDGIVGRGLSAWVPAWYAIGDGLQPLAGKPIDVVTIGHYSTSVWTVTLGAYMLVNCVAEPIVEELYFRGWLLPRWGRLGRWAPFANVVLFSLYHFWLPAQLLSRLAAILPVAYAVRWRRNVYLGMVVHIALNAVGGALVIAAMVPHL
jgi:membrane protease YdiL (CAAX protease family)